MNTLSKMIMFAALASTVTLSVNPAFAGRFAGRNGKGTAAIAGSAGGNKWSRGHTVQNVNGQTVAASGGAFKAANGASGSRASGTTYDPTTGQATHNGGFKAQGTNGSIDSSGQSTYDPATGLNASRKTSATNNKTGNSYNGQTTYDKTNGAQHSGTCSDASGNVINCPNQASGNQN